MTVCTQSIKIAAMITFCGTFFCGFHFTSFLLYYSDANAILMRCGGLIALSCLLQFIYFLRNKNSSSSGFTATTFNTER